MSTGDLRRILSNPEQTQEWLSSIGAQDSDRAVANITSIVASGLDDDGITNVTQQLKYHLPVVSDPDLALNNLERFISSAPDASELSARFIADQKLLPSLLTFFSCSQYLSDILTRDYDCFIQLCETEGQLYSLNSLIEIVWRKLESAPTKSHAMEGLRQFKRQQQLRVAWGDLIDGNRIEQVTQQISWVAMAVCEAACRWARRDLEAKFGIPLNQHQKRCDYVILAMGKLGGTELNYSSDIDLIMVYDQDGQTDSRAARSNREFFGQLTRDIVKLVNEITPLGSAYRVDLRLRPEGSKGAICHSQAQVLKYYDFQGRTWERQALIKARPIAGDIALGESLLKKLQTWIFRISLSRSDISGIKALKRKIEKRAVTQGEERTNIKTGHGGIRDVEFVIQFMQLLNGHERRNLRTANTLVAIGRLERAGCLTMSEKTRLSQNYEWLRKLEHRLQIMFDLQTHNLPESESELQKVALRMGYASHNGSTALEQFTDHLNETTEVNRMILNHLLHGAFVPLAFQDGGNKEDGEDSDDVPVEVELILEPEPSVSMINDALSPYGFRSNQNAYRRLMDLAQEKTKFLSPRRCKHFFAAIAKPLLTEVAKTPDPDATLVSLSSISDSLGAKGVLWELFRFNTPTLSLYVRLCASSDYLASIFKSNPGMIDELMDALQLQQLPKYQRLADNLKELARGAEDLHLIVLSFKNAYHLRVGIRDILGRDEIRDTHRTLSDIAEVCLQTIARRQYDLLIQKLAANPDKAPLADLSPLVILGLGKLGGREPNYHSDLDVIFLYDKDESFEAVLGSQTTSQFFFSELAANITRSITQSTASGRLYELDSRLRPTGKSGALAVSVEEFLRYFRSGKGQLWERQSLCKARVVFGGPERATKAVKIVQDAILVEPWKDSMAGEVHKMRLAMQKGATKQNLKRGVGGTVDIEFAIQMLQLKHLADDPSLLAPGTLEATERLIRAGILPKEQGQTLMDAYQLLRSVEARLRLMNVTARHDLPTNQAQLTKLAFLLNYAGPDELVDAISSCRKTVREQFEAIVGNVE